MVQKKRKAEEIEASSIHNTRQKTAPITPKPSRQPASKRSSLANNKSNYSKSFNDDFKMLQFAWTSTFPNQAFPIKHGQYVRNKMVSKILLKIKQFHKLLLTLTLMFQGPICHQSTTQKVASSILYQNPIMSNLDVTMSRRRLKALERSEIIHSAIRTVLKRKIAKPTRHSKKLIAAFSASRPQVSPKNMELLLALSRYIFMLEVQAESNAKGSDICWGWLTSVSCSKLSPKYNTIRQYVFNLAVDQCLIYGELLKET